MKKGYNEGKAYSANGGNEFMLDSSPLLEEISTSELEYLKMIRSTA